MNELRCLSGGGKLVRVWGRRIAVGALVFAVTALGPIQHTLIPVALAPPAPHPAVLITAAAVIAAPVPVVPPPTTVPPPPPRPVSVCVPAPMPALAASTELATPTQPGSLAYSAAPGGGAVGRLPATTWGGPTVRPVVGAAAGWLQIRLDSRPNGSTGWVAQQDVTLTDSAYEIVVSTCRRTLTLYEQGQPIFSSPVGVGRPGSPTPLGPSFVDAVVATPRSQLSVYGPTVLITGSHSNVYTDFDGGDGTVGIHGYPSDPASTEGVASSHGCVRANPTTVNAIKVVPVGTPIDIIS